MIKMALMPRLRKEIQKVFPSCDSLRIAYNRSTGETATDGANENGESFPVKMGYEERDIKKVLKLLVPNGTHFSLAVVNIKFSANEMFIDLYKKDKTKMEPIIL